MSKNEVFWATVYRWLRWIGFKPLYCICKDLNYAIETNVPWAWTSWTSWTGSFIRLGMVISVESRTPYCRRPRPASASSPWPKKSKSEIFHENQFLTITKQKLKQKTILFIFDIFRTGIDPCFENSFFTNSNIFLIYLLYFSQISHKK